MYEVGESDMHSDLEPIQTDVVDEMRVYKFQVVCQAPARVTPLVLFVVPARDVITLRLQQLFR
jgi:hypothetical protein